MTVTAYIFCGIGVGLVGLLFLPGALGFRLRTIRLKFAELVLFIAMAAIGIIGYGSKFSPTNDPPDGIMGLWNYGTVEISNAESSIAIRQPSSNPALDNGCFHNSTIRYAGSTSGSSMPRFAES